MPVLLHMTTDGAGQSHGCLGSCLMASSAFEVSSKAFGLGFSL